MELTTGNICGFPFSICSIVSCCFNLVLLFVSCFLLLPSTLHTVYFQIHISLLFISLQVVVIFIPGEKAYGCRESGRWGSEPPPLRLPARKSSIPLRARHRPKGFLDQDVIPHLGHSGACSKLKCVPLKGGGLSPAPADYGIPLSTAKSPDILKEAKNLHYVNFLDFQNTVWPK